MIKMVRNYVLITKLRMEREKFESLITKFLASKILKQGDEEKRLNELIAQKRKMEEMVNDEFFGLSKREIQTQYNQKKIEKFLEIPEKIKPHISNKVGA